MIFEHYKMLGCYRLPPLKGISSPRFREAKKKSKCLNDSDNSGCFEKWNFWHGNRKLAGDEFSDWGGSKERRFGISGFKAAGLELSGWLPPLKEIFVVTLGTLFNLVYFSDVERTSIQNTMACDGYRNFSTHVFHSVLGEIYPSSTQDTYQRNVPCLCTCSIFCG